VNNQLFFSAASLGFFIFLPLSMCERRSLVPFPFLLSFPWLPRPRGKVSSVLFPTRPLPGKLEALFRRPSFQGRCIFFVQHEPIASLRPRRTSSGQIPPVRLHLPHGKLRCFDAASFHFFTPIFPRRLCDCGMLWDAFSFF